MKYSILLILLFQVACGIHKKNGSSITHRLSGIWYPVREEIAGAKIPPIAFQSQKLELKNNHYTMTAESVDRGEYKVTGNMMDIYGKVGVNANKHFTAIFEIKGNRLTICYDLEGKGYPATFETKNHAMYFMVVFEKR